MIVIGVNIFMSILGRPFSLSILFYTFIAILILDIGTHYLFANLPKKYRWRG